jgi:hypothetical protein
MRNEIGPGSNGCVLYVRTVEVRRQKRKLLLTDRGDGSVVYKLKKLEEDIIVVFI